MLFCCNVGSVIGLNVSFCCETDTNKAPLFFILSLLNRFSFDRGIFDTFLCAPFFGFRCFWRQPPPSHLFCIYFCSHCCIVSPSSHILVVPVLVSIKKTATTNYADAWKTGVNTAIRTATEFCTRHDSEINFWASARTKRKLEQSGLVQSRLFYSVSKSKMIVSSELEVMCKEVVQACLEQFWQFYGDSELNGWNP